MFVVEVFVVVRGESMWMVRALRPLCIVIIGRKSEIVEVWT